MSHGVFLAIERMGRSNGGKGGRIVNISSVAGLSVCFSSCNLTYYLEIKVGLDQSMYLGNLILL